jgi:hypothetical protein
MSSPEKIESINGQKNESIDLNMDFLDKKQELNKDTVAESESEKTKKTESARNEALTLSEKTEQKKEKSVEKNSNRGYSGVVNKKLKDQSYKKTITEIQKDLSISSKIFSKITHNPFVEKSSEIIGSTVARPNSMLFGAFFSFLTTLFAYFVAKKYGYVLSGFETIGAFVVGWLIGVLYDFLRTLITGKK